MKSKYNEFRNFLNTYPLQINRCFNITKVHRTTFKRWLDGSSTPSHATMELLRLHATGEPPSVHNEWAGWRFLGGKLYTSHGRSHEPAEILMLPTLHRDSARLREIEKNYTLQHKLF